MSLTKSEIVQAVADKSGLTKTQAANIVDTVLRTMVGGLRSGESVNLRHFGTFKPVTRKAREGRNPQTGEPVMIPERQAVTFKASKSLLMDEL
jgi:DNA-binding protein HU-beta